MKLKQTFKLDSRKCLFDESYQPWSTDPDQLQTNGRIRIRATLCMVSRMIFVLTKGDYLKGPEL